MSSSSTRSPGIPVLSARSKRKLPTVPNPPWCRDESPQFPSCLKTVTFNSDTVETSIGGTKNSGKIKPVSISLNFSYDKPSSSNDSISANESNTSSVSNDTITSSTSVLSQSTDNVEPNSINSWTNDNEYDKENFLTPVKEPRRTVEMESRLHGHMECYSPLDAYTPSRTPKRRYTCGDKLLSTPECYNTVQMPDIPRYDFYDDEYDNQGEDSSSVTVAVRVRPYSQREEKDLNVRRVVSMCGNETKVMGCEKPFLYDFSFWSFDKKNGNFSDQETIYKLLGQPLLGKAFEGYNTCLFAYGQTGSGKSYSIMGHGQEIGIIPRFCAELFTRADHEVTRDSEMVKINVEISFFEIYNEKIHDLLASSKDKGRKSALKVREHPSLGPYVEGLSTYVVNSFEDVEGWITLGNKNRATASTGMNDKSSRSHSVFTLVLTQTRTEDIEGRQNENCITSKINLVDLAGSERQSQAQTSGERLREGKNINKSLLTLGMVISSLYNRSISKKKKNLLYLPPYRDSVLTWMLKESLGGNSKTAMLATISPAHYHREETLSTLRYAEQARTIVNTVRVNEDPNIKMIKELQAEIEKLKNTQVGIKDEQQLAILDEIAALREKCDAKEKEMEEMKQSLEERFRCSEERKAQEFKNLEKSGITSKMDNKSPNLVNLNEDPQLNEMLVYEIKEGQTRVGRTCPNSKHEMQLNGALIAENHCIINNVESVITITPIGDAPTYVNGNLISEPVTLQHGDRVILGGDHYFRFNHPNQVGRNKNNQTSGPEIKKDFEFAYTELLNVQEQRLQSELEEARRQAQEEMQAEVEKVKKEALEEQRADFEDKLAEYEKLLQNQTEEVQMAAQGRMEADDIIQELKKQKRRLEQELLVDRKRQQLEAKAAEKAQSNPPSVKYSRLIELLETEKQKTTQRLEKMKQKRSSPTRNNADNHSGKRDLYKIALLLREANKISQLLKKNMVFSREDYLEDDKVATAIKVTNSKLRLCTFWDVPKFEDKLAQMRDLYQNDCDSSADDEVFNDPSDSWQQESPTTPNTPRSPLGNSFSSRSPFRQFLLSGSSSLVSPRSFREEDGCSCQSNLSGTSLAKMCENVTLIFVDNIEERYFEESIADKVIRCCQVIKQSVVHLIDSNSTQDQGKDPSSEDIQSSLLKLANNIQTLSSHCSVWSNMYIKIQRQSPVLQDITCKLKQQVKLMGNHMVMFFQGWGNDIDSLICESGSKVIDSVLIVCKLTGEMALAVDMDMLCLEQMNCEEYDKNELSADICQSFQSGCDLFVDKSLQEAIKTLEKWELKAKNLADQVNNNVSLDEMPQHIEILVSAVKNLFSKCQEIQVEVDTSIRECYEDIPRHVYTASYHRCRGLITHISNLFENMEALLDIAEPLIKGQTVDLIKLCSKLCRCSETIQEGINKLVMVSSKEKIKMERSSLESNSSDSSVISDIQIQQLEHAARDVHISASSLIQQTEKILPSSKVFSTPRRKRLLPASPEKGFCSPLNNKLKQTNIVANS